MNCRRCSGCMIQDHFIDLLESGGEWWAASWRCINCGFVHDPVLEKNRQAQRQMAAVAHASVGTPAIHREELTPYDLAA